MKIFFLYYLPYREFGLCKTFLLSLYSKFQYIWDHFQLTECKKSCLFKKLCLSKVWVLHNYQVIRNNEARKYA